MNQTHAVLALIEAERNHQRESGYDDEHDDEHDCNELICAAVAEAMTPVAVESAADWWPFEDSIVKPATPTEHLIRAAAFLVAELERRLRLRK